MSHPPGDAYGALNRNAAVPAQSRWAVLMLVASVGTVLVALAMTAARRDTPYADLLYWAGLLVIFVPIAARLASSSASRIERVSLLVGLGLWLYLVKVLHSPISLTFYDELLHMRTAMDMAATGRLFAQNVLLPVSPYYPGLQNATLVLYQFAGLPLVDAAMLLMAIARILSVVALFLLFEQVGRSSRLAGLATLIYVTNPAFLYFDKQFAYESLGLPMALLLLWVEARRQNDFTRARHALDGLGGPLLMTVIITHHLTSYALSAFLVLWSLAWLWLRSRAANREPSGPLLLTVATILGTVAWLLFIARVTVPYFGGNLLATFREILSLISGETAMRRLFSGLAGEAAPLWERLVGYAAVLGVVALLPAGLLAVWRRYRDSGLALALALGAVVYPITQLLRFTPFGLQLSGRTPEFIFLPVGFVLAAALLDAGDTGDWADPPRRNLGGGLLAGTHRAVKGRRALFVLWITVLFVGGVVLGWPRWGRLPAPYLVVADSRSIEPQGLAAARWAGQKLEPGQRFAADRVNALLLLAYGRQNPVTASFGGADVPELYFAERLGPAQRAIIRQGDIRYIVIDRRIATDRPAAGVYFEPGERSLDEINVPVGAPLAEGLEDLPDAHRILDSGDIIIYGLGDLDNVR